MCEDVDEFIGYLIDTLISEGIRLQEEFFTKECVCRRCCDCRDLFTLEYYIGVQQIYLGDKPNDSQNYNLEELFSFPYNNITKQTNMECSKCNSGQIHTFERIKRLQRPPCYLMLYIVRFDVTNTVGKNGEKGDNSDFEYNGSDVSVDFNEMINVKEGIFVQCEGSCSLRYKLNGVCMHSGKSTEGHYISVCRNETSKSWYMYDDQNVKEWKTITPRRWKELNQRGVLLIYERETK